MALIKCKECGHEMSSRARVCPNCGCPNDYEETASATTEKSVKPVAYNSEETVKPTADNAENNEEAINKKVAELTQKAVAEKEARDEQQAKKVLKIIADWAFVVLAVIAYFTNPSKEDHVDAFYDYMTSYFAKVDRDYNLGGQVVTNMEKDKSKLASYFQYDDLLVFSRGSGTFGIFGHVFIVAKDEELDVIKKQIIDAYR